jgi:hypothetical protein
MADKRVEVAIKIDDNQAKKALLDLAGQSQKTASAFGGMNKAIVGLASAFAGFFAAKKMISFLKAQTVNANETIMAQVRLAAALQRSGEDGEKAVLQLAKYNDELKSLSIYNEIAILKAEALLMTISGLNSEGLKKATPLVLDLAAALDIDLESAATLVGKAIAGNHDMLGRYGIVLSEAQQKTLQQATASERLGLLQDTLTAKFGGTAEAVGKTAAGAILQYHNAIFDLKKTIGMSITTNAAFLFTIESINKGLRDSKKAIDDNATSWRDYVGFSASLAGAFYQIGLILKKDVVIALYMARKAMNDFFIVIAKGLEQWNSINPILKLTEKNLSRLYNWYHALAAENAVIDTAITNLGDDTASAFAKADEWQIKFLGDLEKTIPMNIKAASAIDMFKEANEKAGAAGEKANNAIKESARIVPDYAAQLAFLNYNYDKNIDRLTKEIYLLEKSAAARKTAFENQSRQEQASRMAAAWGGTMRGTAWGIEADYQQQLIDIGKIPTEYQEAARAAADFNREIQYGEMILGDVPRLMDVIGSTAQAAFSGIGQGIADQLVDGTADWNAIGKQVLKTFISIAAQMVIMLPLAMALGPAMGGMMMGLPLGFHRGGYVYHRGGVVKAHSGYFASDERPAILQSGEYVLPRRAVSGVGLQNLEYMRRTDRLPITTTNSGGGGNNINMTFNINAIDANDFENKIRHSIMPIIKKEIAYNRFNVREAM